MGILYLKNENKGCAKMKINYSHYDIKQLNEEKLKNEKKLRNPRLRG